MGKNKPTDKNDHPGEEEDLWFDAARKLGKDQEDMTNYNFNDNNRRSFAIVGSIFAVFLFGGILWYLYYEKNLAQEGEVPDIRAEQGAVRERPDDPGGMEIPNQDRVIYDKVSGQETALEDRVQPTPEQPLDDLNDGQTIADLINETEPEADASTTAMTQPAATGQYIIQLGAFSQKTGAENAWSNKKERYSKVLGGLSLDIQPVTAPDGKTLYRLRAGYFASHEEAERVCETLKQLGQDCLAAAK